MLGTAHWAGQIHLKAAIDGDEWKDAQIIIEPVGGGGDTRIESGRKRIVEQWKAKSNQGSWSLKEVISGVLPDLYRAVDLTDEERETEFRFVTEGHRGNWKKAEQLFRDFGEGRPPEEPFAALDDEQEYKYFQNRPLTNRGLFRHIYDDLRTHPDIIKDNEMECARKLWYLLARFTMIPDRFEEKLLHKVDEMLSSRVDYREQIEGKRKELCGILLDWASKGEKTFAASELFTVANLDSRSFSEWPEATKDLAEVVRRKINRSWDYRVEDDVREPIYLSGDDYVYLFSGESGQGKTWRLASLALRVLREGSMAVVVSASGDVGRDLEEAANTIWRVGFERESPTDLDILARKRNEFAPDLKPPWLTVCIDNVQSIAQAKAFIDREWSHWGIRLVLTVPPRVADTLRKQDWQSVAIDEIKDFTLVELRRYMEMKGHDWGMLPADIGRILKRPLLANLYCGVAEDDTWRPVNEYALLSRYWQRMGHDHPQDIAVMHRLAATFLQKNVAYPWTQSVCLNCDASNEVQQRLESVGWLRRREDHRVEVVHDRLLNWAIAEAIVDERQSGKPVVEMSETAAEFFKREPFGNSEYMLSYVPMDVCSIMCQDQSLIKEVPVLIKAFEKGFVSIWRARTLYTELLPTVGPRIINPMVERIRSLAGKDKRLDESGYSSQLLSEAILTIGKDYPEEAAERVPAVFKDHCEAVRDAGVRLLKHFSDPAVLDQLWDLHKHNYGVYEATKGKHYSIGHTRTFAALNSCVRQDIKWLEQRILDSPKGSELFRELAYLVANVPGKPGAELWKRTKFALFEKVSPDMPRCLVTCIQQHMDASEIGRLESWLACKKDFTQETAFSALVYLSPTRAFSALRRLGLESLYVTRNWWLPGLLLRLPRETRVEIRKMIAASSREKWRAALVYQSNPNQMDASTLNLLLDEIEELARDANRHSEADRRGHLHLPLSLLADVTRYDLLLEFEKRAGASLERELAELVCRWGGRPSLSVDHVLRSAARILLKISGDGVTNIVNMQLSSESRFAQLDGLRLALVRPDTETHQLLADITCSSELWNGSSDFPLLQAEATVALAALAEDKMIVDAIIRWGVVLDKLPAIREGLAPMSDRDLAAAFEAIESDDEKTRTNGMWALGISGRVDLVHFVCEKLRAADPTSEFAKACIAALREFGDLTEDAVCLLEAQLKIPGHVHVASLALLQDGKERSLAVLEQALRRMWGTKDSTEVDILAANLARLESTRKTVAELLWKDICGVESYLCRVRPSLTCLTTLDDPKVLEFLIDEAHVPDRAFRTIGQKADAIRALAELDADSAFQAAETALQNDETEREYYPDLLMEIDDRRAAEALFSAAEHDLPTLVKWAVARALRLAEDRETVCQRLVAMMADESPETRILGIELAGWQRPDEVEGQVRQIAVSDLSMKVRHSAEECVAMLESQRFAAELLDALEQSHGSRSWSYLEALVATVSHPALLSDSRDPLYLGDRLSGKPPALLSRADDLLEKRNKDVKEEAEKVDRQKKW